MKLLSIHKIITSKYLLKIFSMVIFCLNLTGCSPKSEIDSAAANHNHSTDWISNFDNNWCTSNMNSFTDIKKINIEINQGNIFIKNSTSDETVVSYDGNNFDGIVIEQTGKNININNNDRGFFSSEKSNVDFYISVPQSVENIEICVGKGNIFDSSEVENRNISGGKIDFFGKNSCGRIDFSAGTGSINLVYEENSPKYKMKCIVNSGNFTLNAFLNKEFKTIGNTLKSPAMSVNSFLPISLEGGDFNIAGKSGKAKINISENK